MAECKLSLKDIHYAHANLYMIYYHWLFFFKFYVVYVQLFTFIVSLIYLKTYWFPFCLHQSYFLFPFSQLIFPYTLLLSLFMPSVLSHYPPILLSSLSPHSLTFTSRLHFPLSHKHTHHLFIFYYPFYTCHLSHIKEGKVRRKTKMRHML